METTVYSHKMTVNIKATLCKVGSVVTATHPRFDQQAASDTEHSGQPKGSAHWGEKHTDGDVKVSYVIAFSCSSHFD